MSKQPRTSIPYMPVVNYIYNYNKTMKSSIVPENIYKFTSTLLLVLGLVDLLRGFLHTFGINWAATTFAQLDLTSARNDQLFLLGVFGVSNILTGLLYILVSRKATHLSGYILGIIAIAYTTGLIGLRSAGIYPQSAFEGRYFMLVYIGLCAIGFAVFLYFKYIRKA